LAGLVVVSLFFFLPEMEVLAATDVISFRIGHVEPIGSPMNNSMEEWVKLMRERSNGRLRPSNFPASQAGNFIQLIDASRMGTIEVTAGGLDAEGKLSPVTAALGIGYLIDSYEHADKIFEGPIGKMLAEELKKRTGVYIAAYGEAGFRTIASKKPIQKLEDLKGKKIRVPEGPINIRLLQLLGGNATPVAYAEIYISLQTGVVDAADVNIPETFGYKLYEPTGHITLCSHWYQNKPIRVNARWLDGLPADLRKIFIDTAVEAFAKQRKNNRTMTDEYIQKMKALGVKFYEVEDKAAWIKAGVQQQEEYMKEYPEAADLIKQVRALK
jgi:tripartite ATP-independent transporter DctP family solute receptor